MPPPNLIFTDNTTFINPLGLGFTLLMGCLVLVLPRRFAMVPILAMICYMTMGMRILVGGFNFPMIRVLLVFCWTRLLLRREFRRVELNEIDKALLWFILASVVTHTLLLGTDGLKYKLGQAYDALGFYFFFRVSLRGRDELINIAKATAILVVPLALEMLSEKLTLTNSFAVFGGVSRAVILRQGTARAQGPFGHPILAGTFGATVMPLMVALWSQSRRAMNRLVAVIGMMAASAITGVAGSSGPILAYMFGVLALLFWPIRRQMRWLRRAMVVLLIVLHLTMKAPVWFLLARVSVFDASTGWHRAFLIDRCIANFSSWWLIGTTSYDNWGYYLFDRTNHYICLATDGGLLTLVLFIVLITRCFRAVGNVVRNTERNGFRNASLFTWALGAVLLIHCVSFISCTYFDQNMINWYLLLGTIASAGRIWSRSANPMRPPLAKAVHESSRESLIGEFA
jgi:hypothetical protein